MAFSIGAGVAGSGDGGGGRAAGSSDWRKRPRKDWGEEGEKLMRQVRDLGRYPKESPNRSLAERRLASRLRNARKRKRLSPEQESELQALRQAIHIVQTEEKMEERQVSSCDVAEGQLAERFCKAWQNPSTSSEQEAELQALPQASRVAQAEGRMQEVRGFGRYPMESRQDVGERQLADKLRKARKAKRFSPAQEAELQVLQQAARDAPAKRQVSPHRKAWQKEYDAKRRAQGAATGEDL